MKSKIIRKKGLTLIEILVAAVVLVVAVMGAMAYRYHCVLNARKADVQVTAARLGLMLLDGWKGMGSLPITDPENNYDPEDLSNDDSGLMIESGSGPAVPAGFTSFGSYKITADGAYYYATLCFMDEPANNLRLLNVIVAWPEDYPVGEFSENNFSIKMSSKANLPG